MRIYSSYNLNKNYIKPTFTEYRNVKLGQQGEIIYRMDTCSFRQDLEFDKLVRFLDKKYINSKDVNVVIHACSIGEGAFSLAAVMDYLLGERANKFKPIKAIDKDPTCIAIANNPVYKFRDYELNYAKHYLKNTIEYYYKLIETGFCSQKREPSDILKKSVQFRQGDIFNDVKHLRSYDTVLAARNFWPYLTQEEAVILAYEIAKRFDKSCTLIVGSFDISLGLEKILKTFEFKPTNIENVYEKTIDFLPPLEDLQIDYTYKQILASYLPAKKISFIKKQLKNLIKIFK